MDNNELKKVSTLSLSFVGDSVYDLLVRKYLVEEKKLNIKELNKLKVEIVNCKSQSESISKILPILSEEETEIFKRGRNTKVNSTSKHGSLKEYHDATGLEALFGYLYLEGKNERIKELFDIIIKDFE